jgi:hypothetical protein
MYTGALTICALLAIFGFAAIVCEKVLDRLIFEPMEEDWDALGEE